MKKKQVVLLLIIFFPIYSFGQTMSVTSRGMVSFRDFQFSVTEAGEDFASSVESESGLFLDVGYLNFDWWWVLVGPPNTKWRVDVHKVDGNWHPDIVIKAKRTGTGVRLWNERKKLTISGGESYQVITNNTNYFFNGRGGIEDIPFKFMLSGFSLTMGAQTFDTNIVFTIVDD
ncbi:hypothetical protein [uncultured Draconibacterium sp.]|uniref:hypothetical protein n=1 Tax=uncultured Draconibacterium sp. TaxID=1573823 RepID=UPI0029C70986|nr:hypothetical protein [uncultured Draconibacterium sp.]